MTVTTGHSDQRSHEACELFDVWANLVLILQQQARREHTSNAQLSMRLHGDRADHCRQRALVPQQLQQGRDARYL